MCNETGRTTRLHSSREAVQDKPIRITRRNTRSRFFAVTRDRWIGLDLFFVPSGFLITEVLYESRDGGHYLRNFHARRVLQIIPLFYGSLFLWLVVLPRKRVAHERLQSLEPA